MVLTRASNRNEFVRSLFVRSFVRSSVRSLAARSSQCAGQCELLACAHTDTQTDGRARLGPCAREPLRENLPIAQLVFILRANLGFSGSKQSERSVGASR